MRHFAIKLSLMIAAVAGIVGSGHATTYGLEEYGNTPGSMISLWDVLPGANYQSSYSFAAVGDALTLDAINTGTVTGPVDADGGTVPGDHDQYYTFFGTTAFSIAGNALADTTTIYLQAKYQTGGEESFLNVLFNGLAPTSEIVGTAFMDPGTDYDRQISTWVWEGVDLSAGDAFEVSWSMGTHSVFDAVQLDLVAVPEGSTWVLLVIGAGAFFLLRIWRNRPQGGLDRDREC